MKQIDLIADTTLYSHHTDYEKMVDQIDNYVTMTQLPLGIVLFSSSIETYKSLDETSLEGFQIKKSYLKNDFYIGELSRKYGRYKQKKVKGRFLLFRYENSDFHLIITHERTDFFENGLVKYIKKRYPAFALPFFYSWEIESMLNSLSKMSLRNIIMLTQISRKSRIKNVRSRKTKESDLMWTDMPYKDIFKQTRQDNAWIEKVHFDLVPDAKTISILNGFISRRGIFRCEKNFKLFYESIIKRGVDIFYRRKEKFSNRERSKATNYESKPFVIEFDEPIFRDKKQNIKLIEVLRGLTHSANSIMHRNPYLHVTLTDYLDNSNYEIWVLSENRITIAPQTVCTVNSLNRLCEHISKDFREGEIKDTKEIN